MIVAKYCSPSKQYEKFSNAVADLAKKGLD